MTVPAAALTDRVQDIVCRPAATSADRGAHFHIRHSVFVDEQGVFTGTDRDDADDHPDVVHVVGWYAGDAAGAVRLYPLAAAGQWQGDRLCVLPDYRVHGVGGPLVRCAVALAGARGGDQMVAHIQLPNVRFFERLGWARSGPTEIYAGLPHQPMRIALPRPRDGQRDVDILAAGIAGR